VVQSGPCVRYPFTTSDLCTCRIRDGKGEDLIPRSLSPFLGDGDRRGEVDWLLGGTDLSLSSVGSDLSIVGGGRSSLKCPSERDGLPVGVFSFEFTMIAFSQKSRYLRDE
ncbi:unnamed protein product, partial [Microthlaspi erraticum]